MTTTPTRVELLEKHYVLMSKAIDIYESLRSINRVFSSIDPEYVKTQSIERLREYEKITNELKELL